MDEAVARLRFEDGVPCCRPEDLGRPMPDSAHAVSVCMPSWRDIVDYEENNPRVVDKLACGYPRFFYHRFYLLLMEDYTNRFAGPDEFAQPLPSQKVADQCIRYVGAGRVVAGDNGVYAAIMPRECREKAKSFWQHAGQIISSRQAESMLKKRAPGEAEQAKKALRQKIAGLAGVTADEVFLSPSGMGSIFTAHELVTGCRSGKTVQLGFPYVDTLKVQERFGQGAFYLPYSDTGDLAALEVILQDNEISAVFCEIPGNPLLATVDLPALKPLLEKFGIPLVVDDTIATWLNVDLMSYADITVSSLTKFFSGVGDVMGGSMVINPNSPYSAAFLKNLATIHEDLLYADDAIVLARNTHDFESRMRVMNANAEALADFLAAHPAIETVYYPKFTSREAYEAIKRPDGGYGALLSFTLNDADLAPSVYDQLEVNKGPSLGTNYTLACPYTLLAHYNELDFARANGVSPQLIRVSVGLENSADIIARFERVLRKS